MASYNTLDGTRCDAAMYGMDIQGRRASPSSVCLACLTVRINCVACRTGWNINTPAVASVAASAPINNIHCCLFGIGDTTEPQRAGPVLGRRHQQVFAVLIQL